MGIPSEKIRVVVNRYVKKGWDIEPAEVERALGIKLEWLIPNDFKNAIKRNWLRRTRCPPRLKCDMTQALNHLANSFKPAKQEIRRAA